MKLLCFVLLFSVVFAHQWRSLSAHTIADIERERQADIVASCPHNYICLLSDPPHCYCTEPPPKRQIETVDHQIETSVLEIAADLLDIKQETTNVVIEQLRIDIANLLTKLDDIDKAIFDAQTQVEQNL
jgi:hypothetical protein